MKEWDAFLKDQARVVGAEAVEKWARALKVVDFDAGNLYLEASDSFQLNWFEEHLRPQIRNHFKNSNGRAIKVHVTVPQMAGKKKEWKPIFNLAADPLSGACTFDTYFPGKANQTHLALLKEALEKGSFNPIYIQGPEGCGKTHLLMACAHFLAKKRCFYLKTDTLTNHIVAAIRSGGMQKLRQLYREHDVLLIDDVDQLANRSATQEELFHTFNALHTASKQIILAGPIAPSKLDGIEPRLTSRFEWGLVLPFQPLTAAERREMIKGMPEEVSSFLATEFKSVKYLQMALSMLRSKKEVTLAGVEKSLAGLLSEQKKKALTPEAIVKAVAEVYEIRPSDIMGRSQNQECSLPRQVAMYLCRSQLKLSYLKIADVFSRDHSTVMTSVKGVEKKLGEQDNSMLSQVDEIKSKFKF